MRGKVIDFDHVIAEDRITPAYAGKSEIFELSHNLKKDHPRLCGEKGAPAEISFLTEGSPPPMRGKGIPTGSVPRCSRITPAYAGKSLALSTSTAGQEDHPRLCGEKQKFFRKMLTIMGSPPPMRGKASVRCYRRYAYRITPAYAGKRNPLNSWDKSDRDHPRLCGEKQRKF